MKYILVDFQIFNPSLQSWNKLSIMYSLVFDYTPGFNLLVFYLGLKFIHN